MYIAFYDVNKDDRNLSLDELLDKYEEEYINNENIKKSEFEKNDMLFKLSAQQIPIKYKEKKLVTIKKSYFAEV